MSDKDLLELKHQIERLVDRVSMMEREHDTQHKEILQVTKDTNARIMKMIMYFSAFVTVGTLTLTVLSRTGVI